MGEQGVFNFEPNQNELLKYLAEVMHDRRKQCVMRWFIFTRIKTMDNSFMQQDLILAKTVVVTFAFLQAIYIGK